MPDDCFADVERSGAQEVRWALVPSPRSQSLEMSQVGGRQQRLPFAHFNGLQEAIAEPAPGPIRAQPLGVLEAARHAQARDWRQLPMPQEYPAGAVHA
jgi:hypothetical protein